MAAKSGKGNPEISQNVAHSPQKKIKDFHESGEYT